MDVYWLAQIKSRYPVEIDSGHPRRQYPADSLLYWHGHTYLVPWDRERYVLSQALALPEEKPETLADQVFGNQARQQKLHVMHEASLLAARYELHRRHLRDIKHRQMQVQEELSIARMLSAGELTRQRIDLEKLLVNIESQERDEDIAFWKDTLKLRQEMFSGVQEYQAAGHRAQLLKGIEVQDA